MRSPANAPIALITGVSSGFGTPIMHKLSEQGFQVFGGSRRPVPTDHPNLTTLVLDVREQTSVQAAIAFVLEQSRRIDLLVNNAGVNWVGVFEEMPVAEAENIMRTNFDGVVAMTRAVLPIMRRQRRGRIINISSMGGLIGSPCQAMYQASKFALEGFTEALRYEIQHLGIDVSLVEPGFFKTNILPSSSKRLPEIAEYDRVRTNVENFIRRGIAGGGDPEAVARLVAQIALSQRPRLRYRIGQDARWLPLLKALLPDQWFAAGSIRTFNLPRRERSR